MNDWLPPLFYTLNDIMNYEDFIQSKRHISGNFGFEPVWYPDVAFDFQKEIIRRACIKGRKAIFADTGLGKTLIQLAIAENIVRKNKKKVLILTPLAVSFQFIKEAEFIGIDSIEISRDGKHTKNIVCCNYERLQLFDPRDFCGVICDESSILKNFKGKIKSAVTNFFRKIPYRFLSTATPSPNDFIELGTSSEALGYMGYMDMLGKFFKNNQNDTGGRNNVGNRFYLKPHAENDFFAWVNQWAIMIKKPSDIGFSDERYNLPKLVKNIHKVKNQSLVDVNGQVQMFTPHAKTMSEVRHEQKQTVEKRTEKAYELAGEKTSVYWVNTNEESSLLNEMDSWASEIRGSMSIEEKEDILLAFSNGEIKRLITKAKMTGMGLNWQHCNHTVFFPTWSYEQYYQAIRRFWRFGQKREVTVDLVVSDGQERVLNTLERKTKKAKELHKRLSENANKKIIIEKNRFDKKIILPNFL